MKKVQRFWCEEAQNIRCVREEDFDAMEYDRDQWRHMVGAVSATIPLAETLASNETGQTLVEYFKKLHADRDTALSQLAALREEMAACKSITCMLESREWAEHAGKGPVSEALEHAISDMHNELSDAQQRLSDAERRMTHAEQWSATLERAIFRALDDSSEDAETGVIEITRADYEALAILIGEPVEAALTKPEEAKS